MEIQERINALRRLMEAEQTDIYIVPSSDYHQSEYVGEHFKAREFITGFRGSAGTAVITKEKAGLWTDGRYFIQAEKELKGTGVTLYKMGEPGVPAVYEFVEQELPENGVIGFDGRTVGIADGCRLQQIAVRKGGSLRYRYDLIGKIWSDRPPLPDSSAWHMSEKYSGESSASKIARVRKIMKEEGADLHILSSLDDIAWLLNIRGNDIAYCPLILSYLILYQDHAELYADRNKFSGELVKLLEEDGIVLRPYEEIYEAVRNICEDQSALIDPERINYTLYQNLPSGVSLIRRENPEIKMKSAKNDVEIRNTKEAHLKDAVAHTRFMYWLKQAAGHSEGKFLTDPDTGEQITEIYASDKLESFRREQVGFLGPSFAPISAAGIHGAVVHYSASADSDIPLEKGSMLLTDTGGHYLEGSTDITRTVALGEISRKEKDDFTLVLRAMLRLMNTVFLYGCSGANLDCIAREVFWKEKVNFNHGTGHGVGNLLNVHEPPISFRWREGAVPAPVLEKNMIITDEPGLYIENSHGIRIENELLVCEDEKNMYGQFMHFEALTLVPVDLDAVNTEKLSADEKQMLNSYHKRVYREISPFLSDSEKDWLAYYTREV